jgi:hypothetical protein
MRLVVAKLSAHVAAKRVALSAPHVEILRLVHRTLLNLSGVSFGDGHHSVSRARFGRVLALLVLVTEACLIVVAIPRRRLVALRTLHGGCAIVHLLMVDVVLHQFHQFNQSKVCLGVSCLGHADDRRVVQQTLEIGTTRCDLTFDAFGAECMRTGSQDARIARSFDGLKGFEAAGTVE